MASNLHLSIQTVTFFLLRGLLEEKPELQRVLQQRRLDLHREEELALRPPSDLEQELRKRQQKLQEVLTNLCPLYAPYY